MLIKIIVLASLLLSPTFLFAQNNVLKISSDPWEPWVLGEDGGKATGGIAVKLSQELFRRMGLQVEINIYPYKRCINQMKNGERDILLMTKKTKEREQYMLFSDVAASDPQLIYYSADRIKHFEWNDWKDFKGYTIGGVLGFNYSDFHLAAEENSLSFELVANDNQNIKKLLSGRVDFILLSKSTANYYLTKNPEKRNILKAALSPVDTAEFYFGLSKKGKATKHLNQINKVLGEMKADGSLFKILML